MEPHDATGRRGRGGAPSIAAAPRTAAQLRADRRVEAAHVLDAALRAEHACLTTVAAALGVSRQRLAEYAAGDLDDRNITVADAAGLPPLVRRHLAEYVAGPGYMVAELPGDGDLAHDLEVAAVLARESAAALVALLDAVADGHVTRVEGARLEDSADRAVRVLLHVRELARKAQRDGVVRIDVAKRRSAG